VKKFRAGDESSHGIWKSSTFFGKGSEPESVVNTFIVSKNSDRASTTSF